MPDDAPQTTARASKSEWPAAFAAVGLAFAFVAWMWVLVGQPGVCK